MSKNVCACELEAAFHSYTHTFHGHYFKKIPEFVSQFPAGGVLWDTV